MTNPLQEIEIRLDSGQGIVLDLRHFLRAQGGNIVGSSPTPVHEVAVQSWIQTRAGTHRISHARAPEETIIHERGSKLPENDVTPAVDRKPALLECTLDREYLKNIPSPTNRPLLSDRPPRITRSSRGGWSLTPLDPPAFSGMFPLIDLFANRRKRDRDLGEGGGVAFEGDRSVQLAFDHLHLFAQFLHPGLDIGGGAGGG